MPRFYILNTHNHAIIPVRESHYLVEVPDPERTYSARELEAAADTPGFGITDLLPFLEDPCEGETPPSFDQCEAAGLDGTLRGGDGRPVGHPITWRELALHLLENQPEVTVTRDFWEIMGERLDEIEDEENSLLETTFLEGGVRITLS